MSFNFQRKTRRQPLELQLTAMIDIFTMIVIFLVMGTVIGVSEVSVPPNLKLPKSFSVEALDSAPQLIVDRKTDGPQPETVIRLKSLSAETAELEPIPLEDFRPAVSASKPRILDLKAKLKERLAKLTPEQRAGGVLLNVVADKATPYADLFDVIKVFREAGFESLLFVATGEKMPAGGLDGSAPKPGGR